MIKVKIVAVGNLKDSFAKDGQGEFLKRLSKFAKVEVKEIKESNYQKNPSQKEIEKYLEEEGEKIQKELDGKVLLLDISGKALSSVELSDELQNFVNQGDKLTFVIGGSHGVSQVIKNVANLRISFSKMTFPHGLMRVIFLEQLYRAFTIIENMPYHK